MKKNIVFVLFLIISVASISQPTTTVPTVKTDYLKKSKNQKIVAWSLLLGGIALEVTAFATAYETEFGATLVRAGFLANLASIPFFIMSGKNKRKGMAMTAAINLEDASLLQHYSMVHTYYPALSVKINLR